MAGGFLPDLRDQRQHTVGNNYTLERELGFGGMAMVCLAYDARHDRHVALKVLRPDVAQSIGAERFLREIHLAAQLSHPHKLPLFDSGEANGSLYYVMPNVEGLSLRDRLKSAGGKLPIADALKVVLEVADALDYAHRHGVIHREIKPENIMLHDGHAIVADFRIGKALSAVDDQVFTQAGVSVGTPAYMSPEQASGDAIDGRSVSKPRSTTSDPCGRLEAVGSAARLARVPGDPQDAEASRMESAASGERATGRS